jgi:ribosomal-protein-alanine N-acetyltransferase
VTDVLDQVMVVMQAAFDPAYGEAWTRRQVADALAMPNTHILLVGSAGEPFSGVGRAAGFALSRGAADEEELLLLAVHPEMRGRGVGAALLQQFIIEAERRGVRKLFLEMREGNFAERLYHSQGFRQVGRRRNYYSAGRNGQFDALTFARTND